MSYYAHGDSGYLWLTHEDCEESLLLIEAGTSLEDQNAVAGAHVCKKEAPTPAEGNH